MIKDLQPLHNKNSKHTLWRRSSMWKTTLDVARRRKILCRGVSFGCVSQRHTKGLRHLLLSTRLWVEVDSGHLKRARTVWPIQPVSLREHAAVTESAEEAVRPAWWACWPWAGIWKTSRAVLFDAPGHTCPKSGDHLLVSHRNVKISHPLYQKIFKLESKTFAFITRFNVASLQAFPRRFD